MFTGLIEQVGHIVRIEAATGGGSLTVSYAAWPDGALVAGESVAVQGACLTANGVSPDTVRFDVLDETLARTNLGRKRVGDGVNLERAMRADGRFGGHLVSGHVDGPGTVRSQHREGGDWVLRVDAERAQLDGLLVKGSVAIDGVSLTVVDLDAEGFSVHLIDFTRERTTLGALRPGDSVNLETDMIGKYVAAYLSRSETGAGAVTMDVLRRSGFVD